MRKYIERISLLTLDVTALYLSIFAAYYTRASLDIFLPPFKLNLASFLSLWWIPTIFITFLFYEQVYTRRLPFWNDVKILFKTVTISVAVIMMIVTLGKFSSRISRTTIIFLWCYAVVLFPLLRLIGKKMLHELGLSIENVIIIGAGDIGIETARAIEKHNYIGYRVLGFFDDAPNKIKRYRLVGRTKVKIFGKIKYFKKFINLLNISTVVIAIPSLPQKDLARLTNEIQKYVKTVLFVPDMKGIGILNTEVYPLFSEEFFLFKINNNLKSLLSRAIKKTFDIVVGTLMLPFLLPVIGIIGLAIKLTSKGPIFYTQPRVGRNDTPFRIIKFRSMYRDSQQRLAKLLENNEDVRNEWQANFKLKNDPRITRVGKFLRATSLDELPQIFNVIKGDMSLVGPRPVLQKEIDLYYKDYSDYYYLVRPGISGIWQVSGRSDTDYDKRVRLDTWYVLNWSVWLDVVILFKTVRVVLKREGAY